MRQVTLTSRRQWLLMALFVILYFSWLGVVSIGSASSDARLVGVFEADEFDQVVAIRQAVDRGTLALDYPFYGHFFFNLVLIPLLAWNAVQPPSDQAIIIALRSVSLLSAAAVVMWTFALASRYWGYAVAWAAAVALAVLPLTFNYWAITSHPDTLQVACTMFALYAACRYAESAEPRWLDWAAIGAGLAFSAKYGGLLLLPCLGLLALLSVRGGNHVQRAGERAAFVLRAALLVTGAVGLMVSLTLRAPYPGPRAVSAQDLQLAASLVLLLGGVVAVWVPLHRLFRNRPVLSLWVRIACLFWLGFVITSPFLLNRLVFVSVIAHTGKVVGFGQFFAAGGHPLDWFTILASERNLGAGCFGLACLALALFIARIVREGRSALVSAEAILWFWILILMAMTILRFNLREDRYLLAIIPALLIVGLGALVRVISMSQGRKARLAALVIAVFVWGGWELRLAAQRLSALIEDRQTRVDRSETVALGRRLPLLVAPTDRILYDHYSYVPTSFARVKASWGMTAAEFTAFRPDVIVVNDAIRGRFASLDDAARFYNPEAFLERYRFYRALEAGTLGFSLVESLGPARVYRPAY